MRPPAEPRPGATVALGLLQGPAELLPVSSTAHVELLGRRLDGYARLDAAARKELAVALHAGSALALALGGLPGRDRWALLALATAPAALAGFALEGPIERRLSAPGALAAALSTAVARTVARRAEPPAWAWAAYRVAVAGVVLTTPPAERRKPRPDRPVRHNGRR